MYTRISIQLIKHRAYDRALALLQNVLSIRESILGRDHADTAATHNDIGWALEGKEQLDLALAHYDKSQDIREKVLGEGHLALAWTYHNTGSLLSGEIGLILQAQGDMEAALESFEAALSIQETLHGKDYPNRAVLHANMASVMLDQGNTEMALSELETALSIWEPIYGKQHYYSQKLRKNIRKAQKSSSH
ncbi:Tetratricopeptide repeat protein [Seminavis robusta]|uniref:Tetratricopeptide repeat protein n=1 Tax=Seminavis robusta TaxID=568900 RepID=A0A9N8HIY7_9STRA|nr:Tetratricopeptide repeat protein [Seminavis robusta]|eukprot:Sro655_g182220.1 Tetratricopeptide repeat protein (191) ;mRNA; r:8394-9067